MLNSSLVSRYKYHVILLLNLFYLLGIYTSNSFALLHNPSIIKILYDSSNALHRDVQYHPEQPQRTEACLKSLTKYMTTSERPIELIDTSSNRNGGDSEGESGISSAAMYPFSDSELDKAKSILIEIHTEELVSSLETKCRLSKKDRLQEGKEHLGFIGYLDHDTYLTTESFDVCLRATASWMKCVDMVLTNDKVENNSASCVAMALTRPPGHHATKTLSNGFCVFNFAAAAAVHAISLPNCKRVTILDWDVHYGQGIADIIKDYPNIRYVSMHQVPAFPYMGQEKRISGEYGNIKTVPIPADSTWICGYKAAFEDEVLPFCFVKGEWEADLFIICAGYDALDSEELASCSLNAVDYGTMTSLLKGYIKDQRGDDKSVGLMFGLEGGYQLRDNVPGGNLADAVIETLKACT